MITHSKSPRMERIAVEFARAIEEVALALALLMVATCLRAVAWCTVVAARCCPPLWLLVAECRWSRNVVGLPPLACRALLCWSTSSSTCCSQ
eukprot:15555571-Heterocapsa_arctica.AAC.1